MRIPIRMIGIATTIFWIFLIAFFISAAYSIRDVHFDLGDPQVSAVTDNKAVVSMNITIINRSFYNVDSFNMTIKILNKEGFMIAWDSILIPVVRRGEEVTATENVTLDIDDLLQSNQNHLVNDTELIINTILSMKIAEIIPVQASTSFSITLPPSLYTLNHETEAIAHG